MKLTPHIFWDIDPGSLDWEKNARFIIERVVTRGRLSDWFIIKEHYGLNRIKREVIRVRSLDKLTLNFLSTLLHIPKSEFRCFNTEPSIRQLWNY